MTKVPSRCWIPKLRKLVKKVRRNCHGCKRFQAMAYSVPPPGRLPTACTEGINPFQVIGVNYTGPLRYRISRKREGNAYVLLYCCSLTRGVYLDLLPSLETEEFFIGRRGRPERIYSDNGTTFVGAAKRVRGVIKRRATIQLPVKWQFNLSRAPWWGGQFERIIGIIK